MEMIIFVGKGFLILVGLIIFAWGSDYTLQLRFSQKLLGLVFLILGCLYYGIMSAMVFLPPRLVYDHTYLANYLIELLPWMLIIAITVWLLILCVNGLYIRYITRHK